MKPLQALVFTGALVVATAASAGCANTAQVFNVENAPVYQNQGPLTLEQVRNKIAAGLSEKGWGIEDESKGWMVARVTAGGHWAKVRITYDTKTYTIIHFESSPGLKWNGEKIHRRYNNWIELLDEQIQRQFQLPPDQTTIMQEQAAEAAEAAAAAAPADGTAPAEAPAESPTAIDAPAPDPSWNEPEAP